MRIIAAVAFLMPVLLVAADFWETKSFTGWNEKEVRKVLDDSPWSKRFEVPAEVPGSASNRHSRNGNMGEIAARPDQMDGGLARQISLIVRWQTSLAVKQALVRVKFGNEAGTAAQAREILDHEEPNYVIAVVGLAPAMLPGDMDLLKQTLAVQSSLHVNGRAAIHAASVELGREQGVLDAYFIFSRASAFTIDDKEVAFSARFPDFEVKQKFRLKEMTLGGKLIL